MEIAGFVHCMTEQIYFKKSISFKKDGHFIPFADKFTVTFEFVDRRIDRLTQFVINFTRQMSIGNLDFRKIEKLVPEENFEVPPAVAMIIHDRRTSI